MKQKSPVGIRGYVRLDRVSVKVAAAETPSRGSLKLEDDFRTRSPGNLAEVSW